MERVMIMKINETIAEARKRRGLTQEQLAEKLFVTRQAVSLMGAVLPHLKRWNDTHANEARS